MKKQIKKSSSALNAIEVTSSGIGDAPMRPDLLSQIRPDQRLSVHDFDRQVAGLQIRAVILNRYTALGIPITEPVG